MNLGPLNRRVRLYRNNPVTGLGGAVSDSLTPLRWLPVTIGDIDVPRSAQALREASKTEAAFTTRWNTSVVNDCYFDFEGERLRVVRWRVLGRREGMVFYGERVS
jgi:hypothetical protein